MKLGSVLLFEQEDASYTVVLADTVARPVQEKILDDWEDIWRKAKENNHLPDTDEEPIASAIRKNYMGSYCFVEPDASRRLQLHMESTGDDKYILETRAEHLQRMDKVLRLMNDEENGIQDYWLLELYPDEATIDDLIDYQKMDSMYYYKCCSFFARRISELIADGCWTKDGYTAEFFNPERIRKDERKSKN